MASSFNNSIFWVEVEKIKPNPYQPRREFDEFRLKDLADSVRQYGILQPLVVTRREMEREDGGLAVEYELIAGERRLRAAKLAGLQQVPVVIRVGDEDNERAKLEIAIIENVQREDLNPIDRARAFKQLIENFGFKHQEVANKISKSREYVSNSVRLLTLPQEIVDSINAGTITEGHARPLLMLSERPEEQLTLHKEIVYKKLTVREAERIARHTAYERTRKRSTELNPELLELEEKLTKTLGTRVQVESRGEGGKITIDYFSPDELDAILARLSTDEAILGEADSAASDFSPEDQGKEGQNKKDDEEYLYSVKNFTI
ncbi:MAG: ParB/RepB/Spo0J family partition protein [Parcubacteria group bacterium]|nr:ParB/RepB/Spo0J family partition protein [Parcubacteria group bacterium]